MKNIAKQIMTLCLVSLIQFAPAVTLATYDLNGSFTASGVSASDLTVGNLTSLDPTDVFLDAGNQYLTFDRNGVGGDTIGTNTASLSFTITAGANSQITFSGVSVTTGTGWTGSPVLFAELNTQSSIATFGDVSALGYKNLSENSTTILDERAFNPDTILAGTSKTYYFLFNTSALISTQYVDSISLVGSITQVPEPSTFALGILAFAMLVVGVRRQKKIA